MVHILILIGYIFRTVFIVRLLAYSFYALAVLFFQKRQYNAKYHSWKIRKSMAS